MKMIFLNRRKMQRKKTMIRINSLMVSIANKVMSNHKSPLMASKEKSF
jgi:hypothetical protein